MATLNSKIFDVQRDGLSKRLPGVIGSDIAGEVKKLLQEGGDDRSVLNEHGVNKYYTSVVPDSNILHRGTCTSSTPTPAGFAAACNVLAKLKDGSLKHVDLMNLIRSGLSSVFQLQSVPSEVVLTPSGSDAELIPLLCAVHRAIRLAPSSGVRPTVVSLVTCAGEVGSGTANAAGGEHFSKVAPSGRAGAAFPGGQLEGYTELADVKVKQLKPREPKSGEPVVDYDKLVSQHVEDVLKATPHAVVVVHSVEGSKTGLCLPSRAAVKSLCEKHGDHILVVADLCQMRSTPESVCDWLRMNASILVTGSKFFNGPPFSGAVIIPKPMCDELCRNLALPSDIAAVPAGLVDYVSQADVPDSLAPLKESLEDWENRGLALRWTAAMCEMLDFASVAADHPDALPKAANDWVVAVRGLIGETAGLTVVGDTDSGVSVRVGAINTVVSFTVEHNGRLLAVDELKKVHKWMWMDVSRLLPASATEEEKRTGGLRATIGQPVAYKDIGVLRVCVGAPMLADLVRHDDLAGYLATDRLILNKLALLGKYYSDLAGAQ
eukprot:Rmarinus@m.27725